MTEQVLKLRNQETELHYNEGNTLHTAHGWFRPSLHKYVLRPSEMIHFRLEFESLRSGTYLCSAERTNDS